MNRHFENIRHHASHLTSDARSIVRQAALWYKEQSRFKQVVIAGIALLLVLFIVRSFGNDEAGLSASQSPRGVKRATILSLSNQGSSLSILGTVTSSNEATIRSESSGGLTYVRKKIGDTVVAGEVIAEIDNADERASLLQAEGAYENAKASQEIAKLNRGQAGNSLDNAKTQALNAINSAYATMDDVVRSKTDVAFIDPQFESVRFNLTVPNQNLTLTIEDKRKILEFVLTSRNAKNKSLSTESSLPEELSLVYNEVAFVKEYLDDLSEAYSKAIPDARTSQATIDLGKAAIASARQSISGTLSSLVATRTSLQASITQESIAGGAGSSVQTGSLAQAEAQVKQAEGMYNAALARLQNTIIRSPLNGTVNSISIKTGDYVTMNQEVAVVSNNGTLEIVAYVTQDEAGRIQNGDPVMIGIEARGIVTRKAGALDPKTKKIEVRIAITEGTNTLLNGQSVRVALTASSTESVALPDKYVIPLSALKLSPNGARVFTLDENNILVAHTVREGRILGDMIEITFGVTPDMNIVLDARGLKEGMKVTPLD